MAHHTMNSKLFHKIGKEEHEEALRHEAKMLVAKNKRINMQKTTMETTKCTVGKLKLQPQLTLHSLGKQIKQGNDEEKSNHSKNTYID
jgi:hypothetical protein